jgi:hypothetical protein
MSCPLVTLISGFIILGGGTMINAKTTITTTAPAIPPTITPDLSKRL